jgi:hypothetical protein
MPERFHSHVYDSETTKLMREAFEEASRKATNVDPNSKQTRQLLASAVIDQINAGARDRDKIAAFAVAAVAAARNLSREP